MLKLGTGLVLAVSTNILDGSLDIKGLLFLILRVLVYGLGAAAIVGVVWAGILYLSARDNEAQMVKAKTRLIEVVIGMLVWALMFTVVQWLVPNSDSIGW